MVGGCHCVRCSKRGGSPCQPAEQHMEAGAQGRGKVVGNGWGPERAETGHMKEGRRRCRGQGEKQRARGPSIGPAARSRLVDVIYVQRPALVAHYVPALCVWGHRRGWKAGQGSDAEKLCSWVQCRAQHAAAESAAAGKYYQAPKTAAGQQQGSCGSSSSSGSGSGSSPWPEDHHKNTQSCPGRPPGRPADHPPAAAPAGTPGPGSPPRWPP